MIEPFVFDPRAIAKDALHTRLSWLDPAERARHGRFTHEETAHTWLAGRIALRSLLAERLGLAPREVVLAADEGGRPRLREGGPCFSLSHGPTFVVITVGATVHGVDAEPIARAPALWSMPETIFSDAERAALGADEEAVLCWTLKEAYLKALGIGLTVDPRRLSFTLGPPIGLLTDAELADGGRWAFTPLSFAEHCGAVAHALGERVAPVTCRSW